MADYVFGYGSLLERASRTRTNPDVVAAWPARVTGYSRGWFHQFAGNVGSTCTFLGVVRADQTVNGAIYGVADIESTKRREAGYTAVALESNQIEMLDGGGPMLDVGGQSKVYIFVSDEGSISKTSQPTRECPIVQSYVDICINGCLELDALYRALSGTFTQEFIAKTTGWNEHWVNDRPNPRRPFVSVPNAAAIDRALDKAGLLKLVQLHDLR